MGSVPSGVAVFYGQVDKRSKGWYWTDTVKSEETKAPITGPFETKEQAVENALQSAAGRQTMNQMLHEHLDEDQEADEGRVVAIQSLSNAELIAILQIHGDDDELTEMVEDELERRKTDGAQPQ
jgi:DNA mismatch repair ATPase MutS